MARGDARKGKWRGNWRMEWVASTLHTTLEHVVSSITTANAHNSADSSRLNWHPCRFKWTRPFRRKTKSGFCACAITFQTQSAYILTYLARKDVSCNIGGLQSVNKNSIYRPMWYGFKCSLSYRYDRNQRLLSRLIWYGLPGNVRT